LNAGYEETGWLRGEILTGSVADEAVLPAFFVLQAPLRDEKDDAFPKLLETNEKPTAVKLFKKWCL